MRRSYASTRAFRWVFVAAVGFLSAGCTLTTPGCGNRDVKVALEKEARDAINLFLSTSLLFTSPREPLSADTAIRLVEPVENSRNDTTRECSAKIIMGEDESFPAVPLEYQVIAGEDGKA